MGLLLESFPQLQVSQAWVALQEPLKGQRAQRKAQPCNGGTDWAGRKAQGLLCSGAIANSSSSSCSTMQNFLKGTRALGLCYGKPGAEAVGEASSLASLESWLYLFAQVQPGPAVQRKFSALCPARAGRCFPKVC